MIKAKISFNNRCLCCEVVKTEMVNVGAVHLCRSCWRREFNTDTFTPKSKLGKRYYELLKRHKELI